MHIEITISLGKKVEKVVCQHYIDDDYCFAISEEEVTFENARQFCHNGGGEILVPKSLSHHNKLMIASGNVWLGITNPTGDNEIWMDVNTGSKISFTKWDYHQPDDITEKCVIMSNEGYWTDIDCDKKFKAMCLINMKLANSK